MRNKNLLAGLLLAFAVLIIGSCGQKKIYSHYEHLDNSEWDKSDTLHFGIPPVVEDGFYRGEMGMRIGLDFPYENLVVDVTERSWCELHPIPVPCRQHPVTCR